MSSSFDDPLQVTSDGDAVTLCAEPAADVASLPVPVSATLAADAFFTELSADHTYHHPTRCKALDVNLSSSARHMQYLERRRKNNRACKLSRQKHKQQMKNQEEELVRLEQVNAGLRQQVVELERAKQKMKSALVDAIRQTP